MTRIKVLRALTIVIAALGVIPALPGHASALNRICDPAFEDCRAPLIQLIDQEATRIDVGFWFMEDARYSAALARAKRRGVDVRVLFDSESLPGYPTRELIVQDMIREGIPLREKTSPGILHWKMMLFTAQNTVQFSGANYTSEAFVYESPYSAYVDEVIYFTENQGIVNSFKRKFDDIWISTNGYTDYANVTSRTRAHPLFPIDPQMNFAPDEGFRERSVAHYNAETQGVDAIIYRITDRAHTDALIQAIQRGVRVRLLTEPHQYRDETRVWHSWNVDRLYMAGLEAQSRGLPGSQIRHRGHAGLNHEKLTLLRGQGMTVFGSSNWTSPSSDYQDEHNLFTTDQVFFAWADAHFNRKWLNQGPSPESTAFAPLPPDTPQLTAPVNGAVNQPVSVTLQWSAGPWAHKYALYLGTSPSNLQPVFQDVELGPYDHMWGVSGLSTGTTYYWAVVSSTMANQTKTSAVRSFTTEGTPSGNPPPPPGSGTPLPSPWAHQDVGAVGAPGNASVSGATWTVTGSGADVWGTADEFHFVYQPLNGDGSIVARVAAVQHVDTWTKAGVMIRESLAAGSAHAFMLVTPTTTKGLAFQRRTANGGISSHTAGGANTAPVWVKLTRSGHTITAWRSADGTNWTPVGTDTIAMSSSVLVGLAVNSHSDGAVATATFDNVTVTSDTAPPPPPPSGALPQGWSNGDVGSVGAAGSSSFSNGTFTISGSGADIWDAADGFQFAYRTMTGDGTIIARVDSVQHVHDWTKAGVMIRAALTAGSRHAMMVVSAARGLAFQRRVVDGGTSLHTAAGSATAPVWVALQRSGSTILAFTSQDGVNWTWVWNETIDMPNTVFVGLPVTSHSDGALATATFSNVILR